MTDIKDFLLPDQRSPVVNSDCPHSEAKKEVRRGDALTLNLWGRGSAMTVLRSFRTSHIGQLEGTDLFCHWGKRTCWIITFTDRCKTNTLIVHTSTTLSFLCTSTHFRSLREPAWQRGGGGGGGGWKISCQAELSTRRGGKVTLVQRGVLWDEGKCLHIYAQTEENKQTSNQPRGANHEWNLRQNMCECRFACRVSACSRKRGERVGICAKRKKKEEEKDLTPCSPEAFIKKTSYTWAEARLLCARCCRVAPWWKVQIIFNQWNWPFRLTSTDADAVVNASRCCQECRCSQRCIKVPIIAWHGMRKVQKTDHKCAEAQERLWTRAVWALHHYGYKYLEEFNHKICLKRE